MKTLFFNRYLVGVLVGTVLLTVAMADDDSRFTGDTGGAPPTPTSTHAKHRAKKKTATANSSTTAGSTNTVATPAETNVVATPSVTTNEVAVSPVPMGTNAPTGGRTDDGRVASLAISDLKDFEADPPEVQRLLTQALALTTRDLSYKYGSDDPKNGGMDCSGTVYYLLTQAGLADVPRDASEMYRWVWTRGKFRSVVSCNPDTFELEPLKPGNLLFWSGTYRVDRDPPITHVMIYLGVNRSTGRRVMVGASEGRRFNGQSRYGVSVFDFTMPSAKAEPEAAGGVTSDLQARFVGYGSIPGLPTDAGNDKPGR
jgi:cell wall-associated NlpC family hydrolase